MKSFDKNKLNDAIYEMKKYRLCGPSDDPDEQTAVIYGFIHILKSLKYWGLNVENENLRQKIENLNIQIESIYDVYEANADVSPLLEELSEYLNNPEYSGTECYNNSKYIDLSIIQRLQNSQNRNFDTSKVVQFCKEINSNYSMNNIISVALLIRALINYIPPLFGQDTFIQVVSSSKKSLKELFLPLENNLRDIADLHTHIPIRHKESLPTKLQVEPFKANLEILLFEILCIIEK